MEKTKKEINQKLEAEEDLEERIEERSSKITLTTKLLANLTDVKVGVKASLADGGTITHGLGATPEGAIVQAITSGEFCSVTAKSSTTITVAIKKHDNSAGTTQNVYWMAWI